MAEETKTVKLPRHLLSIITGGNHQAIKAFENIEQSTTVTIPQQIANVTSLAEMANDNALQALIVANQLLEQLRQNIPPVAVPIAESSYLPPVGDYQSQDDYLVSV